MAYSILIVDDSEVIRGALQRTIDMTKLPIHALFTAENGKKALEILAEEWVDIVFSDIHMPGMNGLELIEEMKKSPELSDVPVAVISSEGSKKRIQQLEELGICGYVRKPFKPENIRDIVLNTLGEWDEK
ncbi:MAG: response regulator [Fibrobacterota bacterium]